MSKNTQTVYFAKTKSFEPNTVKATINEIASFPLEPLTKEVKEIFKETTCELAIKCYAVQEEIKNTFVYKAPLDINVTYKDKEIVRLLPESIHNLGHNPVNITPIPGSMFESGLVQIFTYFGFWFFSEEPVTLTLQPPNFHTTSIKHIPMLTGQYDISKWLRPVFPSYANYNYENFDINRGDAMMYIKFNTDKKVVLKEFCMNKELDDIAKGGLDLKTVMPWVPLDRLYKMFLANNMNKKILKQIKSQVI